MAQCEDVGCCGHEPGCCPDYDESGRQLNMKCVCGKTLPITNRYSICDSCMNAGDDGSDYYDDYWDRDEDYYTEDMYDDDMNL